MHVELAYREDLALRVSDDGIGIDPGVVDRGKEGHLGLQGMRERASRIASKLTVASSSNAGTEIKLVVPGSIIYRDPISGRLGLPAKLKSLLKRLGLTSNGANEQ